MLVHVGVDGLRLVEVLQGHRVRPHKLAQLVLRVSLLAHFRAVVASQGRVVDAQTVVVQESELTTVDLVLTEQTTCLPHVAHEHTAHLRATRGGLAVAVHGVVPRVLLNHGSNVLAGDLRLVHLHEDLLGAEFDSSCVDTLVPRLHEDDVHNFGCETVTNREEHLHDVVGKAVSEVRGQARVVVLHSVDPSPQQCGESVLKTDVRVGIVPHLGQVKLGTVLRGHRHPNHVVPSHGRPLHPRCPRCALDAVHRPVRALDSALTDVEGVVRVTDSNRCVSISRSHRPGDHGVQSVKTEDGEHVSCLDQVGVDVKGGTRLALHHVGLLLGVPGQEVDVLLHGFVSWVVGVLAHVGLEEEVDGLHEVLEAGHLVVGHGKDADTTGLKVVQHCGGVVVQLPVCGRRLRQVVDCHRVHTLSGRKQVEVTHVEKTTLAGLDLNNNLRLVGVPLSSCGVLLAVLVLPCHRHTVREDVSLLKGNEPPEFVVVGSGHSLRLLSGHVKGEEVG